MSLEGDALNVSNLLKNLIKLLPIWNVSSIIDDISLVSYYLSIRFQ